MSLFRKTPLFAGALTLCAVVAVGELWLVYDRWAASRAAAAKLVQRQGELAGMRDVVPPPRRDVAAAIEADLARAERVLGTMKEQLDGRGPAAGRIRNARPPVARTDAYFDLATFIEKTRQLARTQGVEIAPEAARFGFSAYANEAPEAERIESVFEQRLIAQYLMEALLEARPGALLAVKREPPLTGAERKQRDAAARSPAEGDEPPTEEPIEISWDAPLEGPDYFTIDPRVSVRAPGYVNTTAFRLVFTGQTASLRQFLNRLASFEVPVLVREVQVDPASSEEAVAAASEETGATETDPAADAASVVLSLESPAPNRAAAPSRSAPATPATKKSAPRPPHIVPIVARPLSKFTVTVEYVNLVEPEPPPADEAPAVESPNV